MSERNEWRSIPALEVEAAAWIAQLNGNRWSSADQAALREWCARSPAHAATLKRLGNVWAELDGLSSFGHRLATPQVARGLPRQVRWSPFWVAHASALVAVIVMVGIWVATNWRQHDLDLAMELYATRIGEQRTVLLPDQSAVTLNTDSLIEVDYRTQERRVRLVKGEALFEVAKNAERPFLVNAAASTVRAVGTRFSVRLQQDNVEVVVSEGKVIVTRSIAEPGASGSDKEVSVLVQKQAVTINEHLTEPVTIQTVDTEELGRRLSWTTGMLEFDGEPLERVVEEVGRYTPLTITIADPDLRQIRVGGRFRVGETKALFDVIEAGFGAKVTYQGNGVVITSN